MCSAVVVTPWKSAPPPPCHPERSMRIRLANPHAQSKDPCTLIFASFAAGSSPRMA